MLRKNHPNKDQVQRLIPINLIVSYEIAPWKQDHLASLVSSGGARYKNEESASARLSQ
jgi:hypothetical protein